MLQITATCNVHGAGSKQEACVLLMSINLLVGLLISYYIHVASKDDSAHLDFVVRRCLLEHVCDYLAHLQQL
jgi:hypothetical protein